MGDLSRNFSRSEFACPDGCGFDHPYAGLVAWLEGFRLAIGGRRVDLDSGCRCFQHNRKVGGAENSLHLAGMAADIRVHGMTARELYAASLPVVSAIGIVRGRGVADLQAYLHIDVAPALGEKWCYDSAGKQIAWHEALPIGAAPHIG